MFLCPKCQKSMTLPTCSCGHTVRQQNNIWQLSDMPDIVTNGAGDKYIGYEHIGEKYSGRRKHLIEERDSLVAKEISKVAGNGIFLDLACGDGCFTVPCAANGTKIIAGDISNNMLSILQQKAQHNGISLENVTLCRMNALSIPMANESIDVVVANSVLHLLSNPKKVIGEIWRVLKKGGSFLCIDDLPGKNQSTIFDNFQYNKITNELYSEYWSNLKCFGVFPTKYCWEFDRTEFCDELFEKKQKTTVDRNSTYEIPLKEGFLPRFLGRGFSDQVDVPKELHDSITTKLLIVFRQKYGDRFADIPFKGMEEDLLITTYIK